MVKEIKYSLPRQIRKILISHIACCFLTSFLALTLISLTDMHIAIKIIAAAILLLVYFIWIFSSSYDCATSDHKSFTPLTPYPAKGFVLSLGIVAVVSVSTLFRIIAWNIAPAAPDSISITAVISNIIYIYLTSPFFHIVNIQGGQTNIIGQIISFIVPVIFCAFGYYAGYKKWDISKYMKVIMFEKKK